MFRKSRRYFRKLLPWFINDTLSAHEREKVETVIKGDELLRTEGETWMRIRTAVNNQPQREPSPLVWPRVMASIHESLGAKRQTALSNLSILAGALMTLTVLILLWLTVQPGFVLQWSLEKDGMTSYRIYRAFQGSNQFELIKEIPARAEKMRYSFVDPLVLPGKNYIYRVEGVRPSGEPSLSQVVNGRFMEILPGQLALILTSLIVGYGIVIMMRQWPSFSRQKTIGETA